MEDWTVPRWKSDSCPAGPSPASGDGERDRGWSWDHVVETRLAALLGDLMGEPGKTLVAETLGVGTLTLIRFGESKRLSPRWAGALERPLLEGVGSAAATRRHRTGMLVDRLAALRQGGKRARGEQAGALADLDRGWRHRASAPLISAPHSGAANLGPAFRRRRQSPWLSALGGTAADVVRADAEPGEESVYSDAARVVIVQRREELLYDAMVDRFGLWRK